MKNDNNCVRKSVFVMVLITDPYQCKHGKHNNQLQCIKEEKLHERKKLQIQVTIRIKFTSLTTATFKLRVFCVL